jgi:hypothetical protein
MRTANTLLGRLMTSAVQLTMAKPGRIHLRLGALTSGAAATLAQFGTNGGHPAQALRDCSAFQPACRPCHDWPLGIHPAEQAE